MHYWNAWSDEHGLLDSAGLEIYEVLIGASGEDPTICWLFGRENEYVACSILKCHTSSIKNRANAWFNIFLDHGRLRKTVPVFFEHIDPFLFGILHAKIDCLPSPAVAELENVSVFSFPKFLVLEVPQKP